MKNNKKGFTLVELLAVIVILAVVILIAVTAVIPRMKKAKWNSFKDEALAFIKAADEKEVADFGGDGNVYSTGKSCYVINTDLKGEYIKKSDNTTYSGVVCRASTSSDWKIYISNDSNHGGYVINGKTSTEVNSYNPTTIPTGTASKTACPTTESAASSFSC